MVGWRYCNHSLSADCVFGSEGGSCVGSQAVIGQRPILTAVVLQERVKTKNFQR